VHRARGDSKVLVFLFAYSAIALALYAIVTIGSPALAGFLGG
jgi:hypothetical protein